MGLGRDRISRPDLATIFRRYDCSGAMVRAPQRASRIANFASGLSCPVGSRMALTATSRSRSMPSKPRRLRTTFVRDQAGGHSAIFSTAGNEDCHVILRGGKTPNYDKASIDHACEELGKAGLAQRVMIDFSHANSSKQYQKQMEVGTDVSAQIAAGDPRIVG